MPAKRKRRGNKAPVVTGSTLRDSTDLERLERQLRESQKLEVFGRLAGGIVHDFNNLLTGVMLYSDLLLKTCADGTQQRRYADEIRLAALRGASMIEQLMAFARQQSRDPVPLSLNLLIAGMKDMLQRLIGENIQLVTTCAEPLPLVRADASQMQQVLVNLLVNAKDAMPNGGRVAIEASRVALNETNANGGVQPRTYVRVLVTDTGCGMDANTLARLFEPFFTTKPKGKGTGLGLATAYDIVKQAGGTISVESEPGKGSRFTILLPAAKPADAQPACNASETDGAALRGTETVLVVEDDALVRVSIHDLLSQCGYTVLQARDGKQALNIAQRHKGPIHLLLTDVVLPGLSGRELAARLTPIQPEMRVLYTSGYTEESNGDGQMIEKPFNQAVLAERIRQVLDARVASAAGAP